MPARASLVNGGKESRRSKKEKLGFAKNSEFLKLVPKGGFEPPTIGL